MCDWSEVLVAYDDKKLVAVSLTLSYYWSKVVVAYEIRSGCSKSDFVIME